MSVTITNKEIYNQLCILKDKNEIEHNEIKILINGYRGQILRLYWALGGFGILTMSLFTILIKHIGG